MVVSNKVNTTRNVFVERFGRPTWNAMVTIAKDKAGRKVPKKIGPTSPRSMAAYRANLTRGAYTGFITVNKNGSLSDKMDLASVR
jgi:hypothetical protein